MSEFFGALSTLFRKMESFTNYFADRVSASYEGFGQAQKVGLLIFVIVVALFVWYILVLILRFSFKRRTRKLKNVRREYQITLNRAAGKRCNFIWDILLFQKMLILDDPVAPKEMLNEKVYLPFQEEHKRVTATEPQPVSEESNVEEVIVVEPKEEPKPKPQQDPDIVVESEPVVETETEVVEEVQPEPEVIEQKEKVVEDKPEVVEEVQPEPEVIEQEEKVVEVKPEVVEVVKKEKPVQEKQPKPKQPEAEKPKAKKPVAKKPAVADVKKTKADLINYMVDKTDLNKSKANKFLKYFAEVISDALKESDSIKLDGFGTFLVLDIEESTRYIPSKDEMRVLPAHKEVRYRAASELKDLLNVEEK